MKKRKQKWKNTSPSSSKYSNEQLNKNNKTVYKKEIKK